MSEQQMWFLLGHYQENSIPTRPLDEKWNKQATAASVKPMITMPRCFKSANAGIKASPTGLNGHIFCTSIHFNVLNFDLGKGFGEQ